MSYETVFFHFLKKCTFTNMNSTKRRRVIYILLFLAIIGYIISSKKKKEAQQEKIQTEATQNAH